MEVSGRAFLLLAFFSFIVSFEDFEVSGVSFSCPASLDLIVSLLPT
jgi:hypothetical protein